MLAAIKLDVPIIIHSRNAEKETLEVFNEFKNKNLKILMHCFTGSKNFAKKLLELDAYFSASGIITFKNSTELQDTFKFIPTDKLLKLDVVDSINSLLLIFFKIASFSAVYFTNDGSFFFPLLGTGAKKGLSVSIKILSRGKNLNVSCKFCEFLKVIIPLAEK